jgi:hypothetical protein
MTIPQALPAPKTSSFGIPIFTSIRLLVHSREDPMKWALRVLPFYYAITAAILALFIVVSGGHGIPKLEVLGAGKAWGIVIGVFDALVRVTREVQGVIVLPEKRTHGDVPEAQAGVTLHKAAPIVRNKEDRTDNPDTSK